MSKRYLVHVPNVQFSETVMGVQFNKGRATVDEHSIDEALGYDVEDIARQMEKLGYVVEELDKTEVSEEPEVKAK